jgi:hypothetical protein
MVSSGLSVADSLAISYTMIFPYIAALLEHVGTAPKNIGLYAGLAVRSQQD